MFWTYNTTSPQIDIILCKEELTLYELLDQENILQELKTQNLKLIEFLMKPEILRELVDLITLEPPKNVDEAEQYKYPNLACELLTSDLPAINERLVSEEILNKLYSFLQNEPPLNPLLSSYFSRTLSILICKKSEQNWYSSQYTCLQALEFLKAKEEFVELLLKHMGTSSIMDLIHNLVTLVEGPNVKDWLRSWLQTQNVIPSIIGLLKPQSPIDCQVNAASLLCSIVQKLRDNISDSNETPESDPILNLLESPTTVELLLNTVFNSDTLCETTIEGGIDILLAIMQPYLPGDALCRQILNFSVHDKIEPIPTDYVCKSTILIDIVNAILPFIKKLRDILKKPIKTEPITLTSGVISPPFGKARLLVAKLITVLISLNNGEINKEIIHCDIPELLLDLFYAYSSNNFLHAEVEKLVAYCVDGLSNYTVTECNDDLFLTHLLKKCRLIQRLLQICDENEASEKQGNYRKGYMGYVMRIASLIHLEEEKNPVFEELLHKEVPASCLEQWNNFVTGILKSVIERHSTCLGGVKPKLAQSSESSFEENIPGKELKSTYRDYDGEDDPNVIFSDDPSIIAYGEDGYNSDSLQTNEEQANLFHAICSQKWTSVNKGLNNLDSHEEDFNVFSWDSANKQNSDYLWVDSDDENFDEDQLNNSDPWSKLGGSSNPWANSSGSTDDANWANFEESFCEQSNTVGNVESCSTLATNVEPYSLFGSPFGSSGNDQSVILSNFSNVKISPDEDTEREFGNMNGDWGTNSNPRNDYDRDMVNLESISGNTLAEKLANAENDIRNEDEIIMRGIKEQAMRMLNDNVDQCESHFEIQEQGVSKNKNDIGDCLTENSVDFVTAENSISDAESSTEFGDAENSLDMDDSGGDKSEDDIPGAQAIDDDYFNSIDVPNDNDLKCNIVADSDIPNSSDADETCNSDKQNDSHGLLVNGDVASCDKSSKDSQRSRSFNKEQIEDMNRAIIDELA